MYTRANAACALLLLGLCSCDSIPGRSLINPPGDFDHADVGYRALTQRLVSGEEYLGLPTQVIVVGPHLVVSDRASDPTLHLLDAESGRHLASFGRRGGGPGEFMNAPELIETPDRSDAAFWAYDVALGRLTKYDLSHRGVSAPAHDTVVTLALDRPLYQLALVGDAKALALGLFDRGRFADVDLSSRRMTLLGSLPPNPGKLSPAIVQQAHKGNLAVGPGGDRVVIGSVRSSRLELYGRGGSLISAVDGPYRFDVDYVVEGGRYVAGYRNRFGYIDLAGTDERLFGLFSGRSEEVFRNDAWLAEYVHEFDWTGRFLRALRLDQPVFDIAVDTARGALFAVATDPEPAVLRYDLPPAAPGARTGSRSPE